MQWIPGLLSPSPSPPIRRPGDKAGSMVTMFFAHGPTVLTNRVRYDTKRHFLKIFFVVYSIITREGTKKGTIILTLVVVLLNKIVIS